MRFRKKSFPHSQFLGNENKGIDLEATESRKEESSIYPVETEVNQ